MDITPSDASELEFYTRAIRVKTAGDLAVEMTDESGAKASIVLAVEAGEWLPIKTARIYDTGTTASGIQAFA
jgi:hypothetical protein